MQENVIVPSTIFSCSNGYLFVGCHTHESPLNLIGAVKNSCNSYFCQTFRRVLENPQYNSISESYTKWKNYLNEFGFGSKLGTDFVNELTGLIPTLGYYEKIYGKNKLKSLNIISLAIGQGEIGTTPLQMSNMAAVIANRGFYYSPHIVKRIGEEPNVSNDLNVKHIVGIDSVNFETVADGMEQAVSGGHGATAGIAAIQDIVVCGKTGTAQNPHGKDHSIFIAFAPKVNPRIAIAVYVENAGFGATYAAPIASLIMEKYIKGVVKNKYLEEYVLGLNLMK